MVNTITTSIKTCDVCGKEVEYFAVAREGHPAHLEIKEKYWYGSANPSILDLCEKCDSAIYKFIESLKGKKEK